MRRARRPPSFDPDRLLHTFRVNAGLPTTAKPYGGWEAPKVELRGHSRPLPDGLRAGVGGHRRRSAQGARAVVAELRKVQLALAARGATPGYLSAFPEEFFDRVEERRGVWAPYYTLHKILAGLLDVHRAFGDATALETAKGMAAWVGSRAKPLSDAQWQEMLQTEFGGMQESLTDLYAVTGDAEHLRLARLFDHARGLRPARARRGRARRPARQHPDPEGDRRRARLRADGRGALLPASRRSSGSASRRHRSYAIGGHSEDEHFFPVEHFAHTSAVTARDLQHLQHAQAVARTSSMRDRLPTRIDFYERGLFNHILASNDPATGGVTYYVPDEARRLAARTRRATARSGAASAPAWKTRQVRRHDLLHGATRSTSTCSSRPS